MKTSKKTAKNALVNVKALAYQMERLAELEAKIKNVPVDQDYVANAKLTGLGIFRLVIMGEIKKGKSSFINALTGTENLVPVHSDVATSTIFKIHYGPAIKYTVYFANDQSGVAREKIVIEAAQLNEYGTEDGNPENLKNVDFIRVESPAPILNNGLVIVDTPGVGGLFKKHREITFRHAPNADAVFFITDSVESPIGADEVKFLKELRQITPLITFIQTKSSKADADARKARMDNNLGILKEEVGLSSEEIAYFIVDSRLKIDADRNRDSVDLVDSGFGPLMSYLNNSLRKNQETNVAKTALRRAMSKLLPLENELILRKEILEADTAEKRIKMDQEISELHTSLTEWEKTSKPQILEDLRKGLMQISRHAQQDLVPLRPGGSIQVQFEAEIDTATTVEEVQTLMRQVEENLAALTSAACLKIAERTKSDATEMLLSIQTRMVQSLNDCRKIELSTAQVVEIDVNTSAISRVVRKDSSDTSIIPEGAVGGFVSGGTTAMCLGMIAGSIIPGLGTIVGGVVGKTIGGIWMARTNVGKIKIQKLDALKRESYAALQQGMASAHQAASTLINNLISDIQMETSEHIQKSVAQTHENLAKTRGDLNHRQKANQQEILQGQKAVASSVSDLEAIKKSLLSFQTAISA